MCLFTNLQNPFSKALGIYSTSGLAWKRIPSSGILSLGPLKYWNSRRFRCLPLRTHLTGFSKLALVTVKMC